MERDHAQSTDQDDESRYAYSKQPHIVLWNLERLAEALAPLIPKEQQRAQCLQRYWDTYTDRYLHTMAGKLGVRRGLDDSEFVEELLSWMQVSYHASSVSIWNVCAGHSHSHSHD